MEVCCILYYILLYGFYSKDWNKPNIFITKIGAFINLDIIP